MEAYQQLKLEDSRLNLFLDKTSSIAMLLVVFFFLVSVPQRTVFAADIKTNIENADFYIGASGDILGPGSAVCAGQLGVYYNKSRRMLSFESCQSKLVEHPIYDEYSVYSGTYQSQGVVLRLLGDTKVFHGYLSFLERKFDGTATFEFKNSNGMSSFVKGNMQTSNSEMIFGLGTLLIFDSGITLGGDVRLLPLFSRRKVGFTPVSTTGNTVSQTEIDDQAKRSGDFFNLGSRLEQRVFSDQF